MVYNLFLRRSLRTSLFQSSRLIKSSNVLKYNQIIIEKHRNYSSNHHQHHEEEHHNFEISSPKKTGKIGTIAIGTVILAVVLGLFANKCKIIPSSTIIDKQPVSWKYGKPSSNEEKEKENNIDNQKHTNKKINKIEKEVEETASEKAKTLEAKVTEELMDANKCLPGYLSERLNLFNIGMLKDDVIGISAELKNGKKIYASVLGTISNKFKTIGLWPESAARNGFDHGVVVYIEDGNVMGILLWGVTQQVEAARQLLASNEKVLDPKELYSKFDL